MALILLVRHAENDYVKKGRLAGRLPGIHLNENGRKQAAAVAEKLAKLPIKGLYSSPLERALETAEPLAQVLTMAVQPHAGLVEVDFGEWQGKTLKGLARQKLWKVVQNWPSRMQFPGGEGFAQAQLRVCQVLEALASQYAAKDILICVTHSDVIKLAVAYYLAMPLDAFQRLHIAPASITTLYLGDSSARLLGLNYEFLFSLSVD